MLSYITSIFDIFTQFWNALQKGTVPSLGYWNYIILYFSTIMQGPTVKLLSGVASAKNLLNLYLVFGVSTSATLTMDFFWYRVGRSGKMQHLLDKFPKKRKAYVQAAQRAMRKNGTRMIVIGKFATGLGIPIHVAAGLSKLKVQRWLPATLVGESLFTSVLLGVGYLMAGSLSSASRIVQIGGTAITILLLIGIWILLPSAVRKIINNEAEQTIPELST